MEKSGVYNPDFAKSGWKTRKSEKLNPKNEKPWNLVFYFVFLLYLCSENRILKASSSTGIGRGKSEEIPKNKRRTIEELSNIYRRMIEE